MTKRNKRLTFRIENDKIIWMPIENEQLNLFSQSKKQICACLNSRLINLGPSKYPGTAQSYKWALLNDKEIWKL